LIQHPSALPVLAGVADLQRCDPANVSELLVRRVVKKRKGRGCAPPTN